jgi:hypothetical protein
MRFFNIDLHISVIADIRHILESMGHQVTSWTLSDHAWVMGETKSPVDVINDKNWRAIDASMCEAFYERYRDELNGYDAFLVTHTPCFAMLYERWQKPIIVVASTRYEQPFAGDSRRWSAFNEFLLAAKESGQLVPLSNNRYDGEYAKCFTGFDWPTITSLCEYYDSPTRLQNPEFVVWGLYDGLSGIPGTIDRRQLAPQRSFSARLVSRLLRRGAPKYSWADIAKYSGIVHVPYNASLMSMFEHYWGNFPIFVPSFEYMKDLYARPHKNGVLSQLSFNSVYGLPPGSAIKPLHGPDPNAFEDVDGMMEWVKLADFYDQANMAHLVYFDSSDDLLEKMHGVDLPSISHSMNEHNKLRRQLAYAQWNDVVAGLGNR